MSQEVFFTSDTHFNHKKALAFRKNFQSLEEMDETLIRLWNDVVKKNDLVYHLGDFAFARGQGVVKSLLNRLNGQVHLILGNHDRDMNVEDKSLFQYVGMAKYIKVQDQRIYLHHTACLIWWGSHRGSWHLYGHSHGSLPDPTDRKALDVGVDCNNFQPVHFDEISKRMANKVTIPVDYHGKLESAI